MTSEGIIRALNLRVIVLQDEIEYLRYPIRNPPSRHGGETINEYANGFIRAREQEIEFIQKLLALCEK